MRETRCLLCTEHLTCLQDKRGQKRGNCEFMESVDTCENHVFHVPWITRKRVESMDWGPRKHGKFGKLVYHYLASFHQTAGS